MPKIEHIFFDLDHTLWDFDKNSELAFQLIFERNKINLKLPEFLKVYMPINFKYWRLFRSNAVSKEELRYKRLKETFDFLNFQVEDSLINKLSEEYIEFLPQNNHLLDGAEEILEYLKTKYHLHIITNGFEDVQQKKLVNSGINTFFESVTTSEEVGVKKPNSKIFEKAFSKAKTKAENSIMVGDSIEADVLGAEKIGMRAIFFNYYQSDAPGNYEEIKNLLDLKNIL